MGQTRTRNGVKELPAALHVVLIPGSRFLTSMYSLDLLAVFPARSDVSNTDVISKQSSVAEQLEQAAKRKERANTSAEAETGKGEKRPRLEREALEEEPKKEDAHIVHKAEPTRVPMTFNQKSLFFLHKLDPSGW